MIVMRKGQCEDCELTFNTEQHHGIFKSSQYYKLNPHVWYNPNLQFELCDMCHKYKSSSPHSNNNAFLKFMAEKNPDKVAKIIELTTGPLINIDVRTMDWESVYRELKEKQNKLTGV